MNPTHTAPTIHLFTVDARDLSHNGKELTFIWSTSGGNEVMLVCGNQRRFGKWWMVEPTGKLTVELDGTLYPDPPMFLTVKNAAGQSVEQTVCVPWPCSDRYFFEPQPEVCPSGPPHITPAAEQRFQHGRMIWLQEILPDNPAYQRLILVFTDSGSWQRYYDTWMEEQPADDPNIIPPPDYYQPARGFGKAWRETPEVRRRLGWAIAPERSCEAVCQWQSAESPPAPLFLSSAGGAVMQLLGEGSGTWQWVTS
jgi:hypothetical protein